MYNKTPSEILFIEDEYTAYCLNEACALIRRRIDDGEKPTFKQESSVKSHYSSFSSLYKDIKKG